MTQLVTLDDLELLGYKFEVWGI